MKNKEKEIPCENCICLSICKQTVKKSNEVNSIRRLNKRCSLIDKYTDGSISLSGNPAWNFENRKKVYNYLKRSS